MASVPGVLDVDTISDRGGRVAEAFLPIPAQAPRYPEHEGVHHVHHVDRVNSARPFLGCEDVVPGRDAVQGRQGAGEKRRTWCALQWRRRRSEDFCTGGAVWPAQSRAYICSPSAMGDAMSPRQRRDPAYLGRNGTRAWKSVQPSCEKWEEAVEPMCPEQICGGRTYRSGSSLGSLGGRGDNYDSSIIVVVLLMPLGS
ncbi:hypothetical protein L226DRAFT_520771 [Lentinus tigrinus ALCF2SS1-7]|uniref:uncharacterized protein n=1 Tax=Lentinus tigrinus ALCF2SS1-7 TaxID=1328758 RepID=UPI0011660A12|nr:hypothetical protein L226DRAFT_520771 [Lentinus tigrinus ALCF2SS1-7]